MKNEKFARIGLMLGGGEMQGAPNTDIPPG
jgi:hypothetical protein